MRTFIFDTETDGLIKNNAMRLDSKPHIIELFGLSLNDNLEEVGVWQSLFAHPKLLPEIIIKITGINDELLSTAPTFFSQAQSLIDYIESHDVVVGHNLTFDMAMVDNDLERCNLKVNWPKERICTVEQTEFIKGFRLSLTALHEYLFGVGFKDAHRAETDVRALTKCYIELKKRDMI